MATPATPRRNAGLSRWPGARCWALSASPSHMPGSDASNLRTRAVRRGDVYVLDGVSSSSPRVEPPTWRWSSLSPMPPPGKRGISCFIVPTKAPGYRVASVEKKLGQRASDTCQIAFEPARCRWRTCWAVRARANRIAWPISRPAGSASPRSPSAWPAPPSRLLAPMPANATPSVPPSSITRLCSSAGRHGDPGHRGAPVAVARRLAA